MELVPYNPKGQFVFFRHNEIDFMMPRANYDLPRKEFMFYIYNIWSLCQSIVSFDISTEFEIIIPMINNISKYLTPIDFIDAKRTIMMHFVEFNNYRNEFLDQLLVQQLINNLHFMINLWYRHHTIRLL